MPKPKTRRPRPQAPSHAPFVPISFPLTPFLTTLPRTPSIIYIVHIDRTPWTLKRRLFFVPLALNVFLVSCLLYRLYFAVPTYLHLLATTLGYETDGGSGAPKGNEKLWLGLRRAGMFALDWFMWKVVSGWPMEFWKPGGAFAWRWRIGFSDGAEIVVRRCRPALSRNLRGRWWADAEGERIIEKKVRPVVDKGWMKEKSGIAMVDRSWELDYEGMVTTHRLLEEGALREGDFSGGPLVLVFDDVEKEWMVWKAWGDEREEREEEGSRKLRMFKDNLTALGKENLFFRWVEMMQLETSSPGGFTSEKREQAVRKGTELFQQQGVDWDEVMDSIGGIEGLPGMEVTA
ncbi:MAG: hypothetical protein LQ342_000043 [Letrouitia transgressa]|nr:MAG: hypothetical protein LQ342_000043 [Letrouitia transgressa]